MSQGRTTVLVAYDQLDRHHGALALADPSTHDVLMVESRNHAGALSKIAKVLSKKKINIDYAYLASYPADVRGLLILRVSYAKTALGALKASRI